MPTDKQHFDMERANYTLFWGDPKIVGYEKEETIGTGNETGKVLGTIELDTKSNELIVTLNDQQK